MAQNVAHSGPLVPRPMASLPSLHPSVFLHLFSICCPGFSVVLGKINKEKYVYSIFQEAKATFPMVIESQYSHFYAVGIQLEVMQNQALGTSQILEP